MPSRSRKKKKGQARKAEAAAELQRWWIATPNDLICNHGQAADATPQVCLLFLASFYQYYNAFIKVHTIVAGAAKFGLDESYSRYPEAVNNEKYLDIVKKKFISNGVSYLLGEIEVPSYLSLGLLQKMNTILGNNGTHITNGLYMAHGCASALMLIDSYVSSYPVPPGDFDQRDAKQLMVNTDIMMGCSRSLVKCIMNKMSCKCLDELYSQIKSTTPKIASCLICFKTKRRSSMFMCTGCERITYCSKACQIAHVFRHKQYCKKWQSGGFTYDL